MNTTNMKSDSIENGRKLLRFVRASHEYPYGALILESPDGNKEVTKLQRISASNLYILRKRIYDNPTKCCALIVYKQGDIISWAKISKKNNVRINCSSHKCGRCEHCSAAPDNKGGCAKVRDIPYEGRFPNNVMNEQQLYEESLEDCRRIEKYRFIREGVELFNINGGDESVIYSCNRFEEYYKHEPLPLGERVRRIEALRYFVEDTDVHINSNVRYRDFY